MESIISLLDEIANECLNYQQQLKNLKHDFETQCFVVVNGSNPDTIIRHQVQAYGLFQMYLGSQLDSIHKFKTEWDRVKQIDYLMKYDAHTLTNSKFYDYAVGHQSWRAKREDLYQLIESKIQIFQGLSNHLKQALGNFVIKNRKEYLHLISPDVAKILESELDSENGIISTFCGEYINYRMFFQLEFKFETDYRTEYPELEFTHLNDVHYWNEEYRDRHSMIVSGFKTHA